MPSLLWCLHMAELVPRVCPRGTQLAYPFAWHPAVSRFQLLLRASCHLTLLYCVHTDNYGPRFGISLCLLLTAPCVFCMAMVTNAAGFIAARFMIGMSLAAFVACQYWCTNMFNTKIVGTANAFAAGWVSALVCFKAVLVLPVSVPLASKALAVWTPSSYTRSCTR